MPVYCECKKCKATPAAKNRHANQTGTAEQIGLRYELKNGDKLIHWSRYGFDKMYSTEKAEYEGRQVVSAFFYLYPQGSPIQNSTPKELKGIIGGEATDLYEIDAGLMIARRIYTNQFQVYTRLPVPNGRIENSRIEAIVVLGCGNAINFPSNDTRNHAEFTVRRCEGFDCF
ncbi:MAG: hypothetical protein COC04_00525 [Gammaproteobacteria bacterium]|nr:MAG: hypothetical protein COC04_00525 [Gammaproteobacteria bacterium]